jgi:hypothetical protein
MKPCTICNEPGIRDSVDRHLNDRSIRDVSTLVKRSKSSIHRHKAHGSDERDERGVKIPTPKAPKKKPPGSAPRAGPENSSQAGHGKRDGSAPIETRAHLVDRFRNLLDEAEEIIKIAKRRGDSRLALQAMKSAQESVLQIGKTLGLIVPDGQTFIDARRQSIEIFDSIPVDEARRMLARLQEPAVALPGGGVSEESIEAESRPLEP